MMNERAHSRHSLGASYHHGGDFYVRSGVWQHFPGSSSRSCSTFLHLRLCNFLLRLDGRQEKIPAVKVTAQSADRLLRI